MNQKTINYVGAGIIAVLLLGLILAIGTNGRNKKNLRTEKTTSEALLFEKQKLEGNLEKLKSDFSVLKQQSDANDKLLSETNSKIAENDKRINALTRDNRILRGNSKEFEELKKAKNNLDMAFSLLEFEHQALLGQKNDLQNSLNTLEAEKRSIEMQLENAQLYNTDNFLVTATRGKKTERVVIRASRAKKLNMAFEVPQSLTETISFKIVTPSGSTINPEDRAVSWTFPLDSRNFIASLSSITGEFEQSRQVVLNYAPKTKLAKGEYKIEILSGGNNIGNCRLMLK